MTLTLIDLADGRRANKPWLPDDDRDVTNGLVVPDDDGYPTCVRHGAMNRVHPVERIYRCSEQYCGVGARVEAGQIRDHLAPASLVDPDRRPHSDQITGCARLLSTRKARDE